MNFGLGTPKIYICIFLHTEEMPDLIYSRDTQATLSAQAWGRIPGGGKRVAEGEVEVPDLALTPALGCLQSSASEASGLGTPTAAR